MVVATKSAAKPVTDRSPRPPRSDPNGDGKTKAKTKAVKIAANTHALLAKLSADQERPMGDVVAELIENERRRLFMVAANEDYARLRADPEA